MFSLSKNRIEKKKTGAGGRSSQHIEEREESPGCPDPSPGMRQRRERKFGFGVKGARGSIYEKS
jgi:hypothetical protein